MPEETPEDLLRRGIAARHVGDLARSKLYLRNVLLSADPESNAYRSAAKLSLLNEQFLQINYDGQEFYLITPVGRKPDLVIKRSSFQEGETLTYLRREWRENKTVLDVGCNIGNHSLFFHTFLNTRDIFGFDPAPTAAYFYCQNVPEAKFFNIALGRQEEGVEIVGDILNESFSQSRIVSENSAPRHDCKRIKTRSLDSFDFKDVTLLKVDVESWELPVLEGGMRTIKRDRPAIVIEFLPDNREAYSSFFAQNLPEYRIAYSVESPTTGRQDLVFRAD